MTMDLMLTAVVAGVLGTISMDLFNHLFAHTGMISKIDVGMIGRMATGWMHGRFRYSHPSEMRQVAYEKLYGYISHYGIGVGFTIPFVLGWAVFVGGAVSPLWALIYGVATTAASVFIVYPFMGMGVCGWRSPDGIKAPLSSLANHFFFGLGMAVSVAMV